jgi:hypothetical protein
VGIRVVAGDPVRPPVADRRRELRVELGGIAAGREPERELTDHEVIGVPAQARRGEERRGPLDRSIQRRDDLRRTGLAGNGPVLAVEEAQADRLTAGERERLGVLGGRSRIRVAESLAPAMRSTGVRSPGLGIPLKTLTTTTLREQVRTLQQLSTASSRCGESSSTGASASNLIRAGGNLLPAVLGGDGVWPLPDRRWVAPFDLASLATWS